MMGVLGVVTSLAVFLTLIPSDIALLTPISKCISLSKVHIEKNKIIQKVAAFSAGLMCLCGHPSFAAADMGMQS
jgi:predicted RND superfamily exporter protein